jgi:hypothetical protein
MKEETIEIELDFSKLTLGDIAPVMIHGAPLGVLIDFADKVVVGGAKHMPINVLFELMEYITPQFINWLAEIKKSNDSQFTRMFDGINGL